MGVWAFLPRPWQGQGAMRADSLQRPMAAQNCHLNSKGRRPAFLTRVAQRQAAARLVGIDRLLHVEGGATCRVNCRRWSCMASMPDVIPGWDSCIHSSTKGRVVMAEAMRSVEKRDGVRSLTSENPAKTMSCCSCLSTLACRNHTKK